MMKSPETPRWPRAAWIAGIVALTLILLAALAALSPLRTSAIQPEPTVIQARPVPTESIGVAPYQRPEASLYVLDLNQRPQDLLRTVSYVRVINPASQQEVTTIPARSAPNIALSADGRYLYVLDAYLSQVTTGTGVVALSIHDMQQGRLAAEITLPPTRTPYIGIPSKTELLPTPDGSKVHVLLHDVVQGLQVVTVDTQTQQIVQDIPTRMFCDGAWLVPTSDQLVSVCGGRMTAIDLATKQITSLPLRVADGGQEITAMHPFWAGTTGANPDRVYLLDTAKGATVTILGLSQQAQLAQVQLDQPADAKVATPSFHVAPDGTRIYIGYRSAQGSGSGLSDETIFGAESYADHIGVFDSATGKRVGWITLERPVISFTISRDGRTLYGASPQAHSISAIDIASGTTITISSIGETPLLVVPGP
jgi:DNA-binding beta-propeller fold protein YncE